MQNGLTLMILRLLSFLFMNSNRNFRIMGLKKLFLFLIFSLSISIVYSTDIEGKIQKSEEFAQKYIKHFNENESDSLAILLRSWEIETGMNEALFRAYSLFLADKNQFPGTLLPYGLLEYAIAWEIRYSLLFKNEKDDFFYTHPEFFSYILIGGEFDRFTIDASRRLLSKMEKGSLSHSFIALYTGDIEDFFKALPDGTHENTLLGVEYIEKAQKLLKMPETHLAINIGGWFNQGNLNNLGTRPSLGVAVGRWYPRFRADLAFDVRFFDTNKTIQIALTDTIMLEVGNFMGARIAFEGAYSIIKANPYSVDVFLGAGYEWFEMFKSWQDRRGDIFSSPALSVGLTCRYFFPNRSHFGISSAYHLLWFDNPGGTPLDGNAITVSLQIGILENPRKKVGLNRFGINYW